MPWQFQSVCIHIREAISQLAGAPSRRRHLKIEMASKSTIASTARNDARLVCTDCGFVSWLATGFFFFMLVTAMAAAPILDSVSMRHYVQAWSAICGYFFSSELNLLNFRAAISGSSAGSMPRAIATSDCEVPAFKSSTARRRLLIPSTFQNPGPAIHNLMGLMLASFHTAPLHFAASLNSSCPCPFLFQCPEN